MYIPSVQDAAASTVSTELDSATHEPSADYEPIRHILFGTLSAVRATIRTLHKRGYAEPNDWSQPISTGRPNEVMAILTKRIKL